MIEIRTPSQLCTVIVTVDADADVLLTLEEHARAGLGWFAAYEGFIGGALHKSADGTRLVQYLQWKREEHYLACMNDPKWEENPSTRRFMALVEAGRARVDARVYEVVSDSRTSR